MKTIRTYLDSGVLIAAWRGIDEVATKAFVILEAENRELAVSPFVKLEVGYTAICTNYQSSSNRKSRSSSSVR